MGFVGVALVEGAALAEGASVTYAGAARMAPANASGMINRRVAAAEAGARTCASSLI